MGTFLFLGPTGVGKTELARVLARRVFGSDEAFVKFNMGDYQEKHEIAKLIGSPPGYIGSEVEGALTLAVKAHPDGMVLLLDEIEKAHRSVSDLLLAAIDDGFFTGNKGVTVSLKNVIVIMTSNLGSGAAKDASKSRIGFGSNDAVAAKIEAEITKIRTAALTDHFRTEFLNRIDEIIHFEQLSADEMGQILDLRLKAFSRDLEGFRLTFSMGERIRAKLIDDAVASGYGAREMINRGFPREVEDRFANALLEGIYRAGGHYTLELDDDGEGQLVLEPLGRRAAA